jgi:hypothetical protein
LTDKQGSILSNVMQRLAMDTLWNQFLILLLHLNPAYWNKSLSRSAIQFLSFTCPADKDFITNEMEERLKNNNGDYHVSRFVKALDIITFTSIIDK